MGLDQYLSKKTYVKNWDDMSDDQRTHVTVTPSRGIDPSRVSYIVEEVGCWRKANQIHNWFVENVQNGVDDCGAYEVSREQLASLLGRCIEALEGDTPFSEILPTQSGFFFGSTDYDEWYVKDLEDTVKMLTDLLNEDPDGSAEYEYRSSW